MTDIDKLEAARQLLRENTDLHELLGVIAIRVACYSALLGVVFGFLLAKAIGA